MKNKEEFSKRTGFLIGLNIALAFVLLIFNYNVNIIQAYVPNHIHHFDSVFLLPPITKHKPLPPEIIFKTDVIDPNNDKIKIDETDVKPFQKTETNIKSDSMIILTIADLGKKDELIKVSQTIEENLDEQAFFNGGTSLLHQFFQNQFTKPWAAKQTEVYGKVFLIFVVERDGSISNIGFLGGKERQLGYGIEQEIERVIKLTSGRWTPGKINGKPVRSYWRFPIEIHADNGW